jgi:hypothetical protein
MSLDADQLFALLPAVYRTRDTAGGGQLQALFAVMAVQSGIVEDNINQLYDDQFIETCAPWVIPYLGDLIGYNSIYEVASASSDSRAEVADTIGYRRRKGTLLALEQLAMDISGRAAVAVEEFRRLITTESMRHVRPAHDATVDLRHGRALRLMGTAFDVQNRTIDVRRIGPRSRTVADPDPTALDIALHGPGRACIPDVAVHLWRWQSWPVSSAAATAVGGGRYRFSPLGHDMPLFSSPQPRIAFSSLTTRLDVPLPIARQELADFYGPDASILLTADDVPVAVDQVYGANLADRPGGAWCTVTAGKIAIDPELGRVQFADDVPLPQSLQVNYLYGFPAAIGGGPYDRSAALSQLDPAGVHYRAIVGSFPDLATAVPSWTSFPDLASAVAGWNQVPAGSSGIIVLPGFESLTADLTGPAAVLLPAGSNLALVAGQPVPAGGPREVTWNTSRVTITGDIEVTGVADPADESASPGQLLISGAWLAGQLLVTGEAPAVIQVADATLVPGLGLLPDGDPLSPGDPSIVVTATGTSLSLDRVITGPVAADPSGTTKICNSIIDATSPFYVAYAGPDLASVGADLHVEGSTIIGKVCVRTMTLAANTIFHARLGCSDPWRAAIRASRQQAGCVRFCVLPFGSITPSRYQCLPPSAAAEPALEPSFVTLRYGRPGYALLSGDVPMAIWTGADNGSQLGAYLQAQETEAVSNVQLRAPEYLPALLESGVFIHPAREAELPLGPAAYGYYPRCYDWPADPPGIGAGLI